MCIKCKTLNVKLFYRIVSYRIVSTKKRRNRLVKNVNKAKITTLFSLLMEAKSSTTSV